jgi:hypothetical protein
MFYKDKIPSKPKEKVVLFKDIFTLQCPVDAVKLPQVLIVHSYYALLFYEQDLQ